MVIGVQMGSVQTVLGPITESELGITLMHEHVWSDLSHRVREPKNPDEKSIVTMPVSIENLGLLKRNVHFSRDNLRLDSEDVAAQELLHFKQHGGRTIVEETLDGFGRNPWALVAVSEMTGLNILASTGWYTYATHPTYVKKASVEQLTEIMIAEIEEGIGNTGIKAGVIGECAASGPRPYHDMEKKVLQAACRAQAKTGVGFTFHQLYDETDFKDGKIDGKAYEYYLDIVEAEGADMNKFYLSHVEFTFFDLDYQCRIMDKGVTLEYDCFGMEYYYDYALTATRSDDRLERRGWGKVDAPIGYRFPTDAEMVQAISELCSRGYEKSLVLSHDTCHKTDLKRYGGQGYSHILKTIVPWLREEGVRQKQIRTMLVENPVRILVHGN